jgi:hypothetical protein
VSNEMENVVCSIDLELTDKEDHFGEGWDFTIGIYSFTKISEQTVRVSFTYEDEVLREEDGDQVYGLDDYSERFVAVEEDLQTLLDVITFQRSGTGLRILPETLEMQSRQMTSHRSSNQHSIDFKDYDEIKTRFERTLADRNEKLLDALRLNRLASNEENDGEKIGQLWGAVERLYASDPPRVLDTKLKRKEIRQLIDQATLIDDKCKERLKKTITNTYKKNKPSVIAENFGLLDGSGEARSVEDVKQELDYWIGTRSIQSHGEILMKDQNVHMLANSMAHIMETALSGEMRPSKYVYMVYKASELREGFLSGQKAATKIDDESGYSYTPLHKFAAFDDIPDRMRHGLQSDDCKLFLVDYKSITQIMRGGDEVVAIESFENENLATLIQKLQDRLNS